MKILLVEDDSGIRKFIKEGLEEEGFSIDAFENGSDALELALERNYELILLDWMLPGKSGIEITKRIRENDKSVPIIFLTAKDTVQDTIHGLESGANDYIKKPFSFEELLARIRVQLRDKLPQEQFLTLGNIKIDTFTRTIFQKEKQIDLTQKEYDLFEFLVLNKGKVATRNRIFEYVWDINFETDTSVIDVYINFLRKKINLNANQQQIRTIRGVGYLAEENLES
ncbi:MAG: response regulator transcription factor [Melioribacteraceae bacterium]|nr:response regulator transcription factor [Melioribacteraceae bacterium]MCF8263703.1 response regulator transcription factor [Melioribacteraceae bacterium]